MGYRILDALPDSQHETLLLLWVGTYADGSEKLPDVDTLARVDASREYLRKRRFENVEEQVEDALPVTC